MRFYNVYSQIYMIGQVFYKIQNSKFRLFPSLILQAMQQSSQPNQTISKTDNFIKQQILYIYCHLIKLGYPKILSLSLEKVQQIKSYLFPYFQFTPARLQLLQWLIAIIYPEYREQVWYITQKQQLCKIVKSLWKVGVMPVNKHTKNLDYNKYVQGLLGYENAVNLVYNLIELAYQSVLSKKSKQDLKFGLFFHELIDNFSQLVNEDYDLYGITFPPKFISSNSIVLSNESRQHNQQYIDQFSKQYNSFVDDKIKPLIQKQDQFFQTNHKFQNQNQTKIKVGRQPKYPLEQSNQCSLQHFVQDLTKYGKEYKEKYQLLCSKIHSILQNSFNKNRLIHYYKNSKSETQQNITVKQSIERRSIKISPEFCTKYQNYKRILRQIKSSNQDKQFMQQKQLILDDLAKINQLICL